MFLALAAALFHEAVLLGRQFFYRDLTLIWHPEVEAFVRSVAQGSWPLWNPYLSFGEPMLANPNYAVLYPFTWLHLLMGPWTFYTVFVVFHFVLAGTGLEALGRRLGLSRGAAIVAGLLWVVSGPFLALVNVWSHFAGAAWLPWVVWAGDRALDEPGIGRGLAWGALVAATILCGSPDMGAMAAAACAGVALRHLPAWRGRPAQLLAVGACALLAAVFAVALSAGQWLPSVDVARHSMRAQMPEAARAYWSMHPVSLLQVAFPLVIDKLPLQAAWRARWFESREMYLVSVYLGLAWGLLVLAGLAGRRARRWAWPVALLVALSVLFALGRHAPAYEALMILAPPLRALRYPVKAMVLAAFGASLLAGLGYDAWRERQGSDRTWTLLTLIAGIAALAGLGGGALVAARADKWGPRFLLVGPVSQAEVLAPISTALVRGGALAAVTCAAAALTRLRMRPGPVVLAGVAASTALVDLVLAQRGLNPTAPRAVFEARPPVASVARPARDQRLFVFDYTRKGTSPRLLSQEAGFESAIPETEARPWHSVLGLKVYAFPPLLAVWGLEGSYGRDFLGLFSPEVMTLNTLVEAHDTSPDVMHRLLRLGAVEKVVALHSAGFEELTPVAVIPSLFTRPIQVFRVPDTLPRAYAVGRGRLAPVGQGWRALLAADFDPAREVLLPEGPLLESDAGGSVRITDRRPDRVELQAQLDAPGYVVLVDAYDPGWRATVDGRPTRTLRANVAFRAVEVPAGPHHIRFVYRPTSVAVGVATSAAALVLGLGYALSRLRTARARAA
jgi:hypothetical protein